MFETTEEQLVEREKQILSSIIKDMRPDIIELIDEYSSYKNDANDLEALKKETADNIIEIFLRAANRINRFSEYKSKVKVLGKKDKLSKREKERCSFIIRVNNKDTICVLKDDSFNSKGTFRKKDK